MKVIYYNEGEDTAYWLAGLRIVLPQADIRQWRPGDNEPADYALVWKPPVEMRAGRKDLKAIFNLAAGVDQLLKMGDVLPNVPIIRLEDAGMGIQIAEYVSHAVIRHYRHFDEYEMQATKREWKYLPPPDKQHFTVGIMGLGAIGYCVAQAMLHFGFPVRGWSRSQKHLTGIHCFAGNGRLDDFLDGVQALVCTLPLTTETTGLINRNTLDKLGYGAYLINVGRGEHLVEADLLAALDSGQIAAAALDVFRDEPLPPEHPFWQHPRITITPHIGAATYRDDTVRQVAEKLRAFHRMQLVTGIVDRAKGY